MGAVIAVDGPAGSGKSSVCRGAARALGYRYLDTGAMYRALTWAVLQAGVPVDDAAQVAAFAAIPAISSGTDPDDPTIEVDGIDVSGPIRSVEVTSAVSPVSAVPEVRARLVQIQRQAAAEAVAAGTGIVVEGRDIGSVVLPDADLKIFLTADPAVRALRRAKEQAPDAAPADEEVSATQEALIARDAYDSSRTTSPLTQAPDAVVIDTTQMTLDDVISRVCDLVVDAP
jgi:cytidylate kinase